ncbi:nascent polypeptide-associated complex subunit alpha [Vairimorpha necatrix]|uniref:Nascent polypeptide-associated complex subunit beta n=1 Tax=Vairimorpha necatrix TaxID=6039 RepID=A0AAX4JGW6_9MICR
MTRDLQVEESKILSKFGMLKINELEDVKKVNFSLKKGKFFIENPKVYEFEETDSVLILGDPKQVLDLEFLKKMYSEKMKNIKK